MIVRAVFHRGFFSETGPGMQKLKKLWQSPRRSNGSKAQAELPTLPPDIRVDEETLPHYDASTYYPVRIGDCYNLRYRIIGKVGFGAYSTVWLCRDLKSEKSSFVALKISTSLKEHPEVFKKELEIYKHLESLSSHHLGSCYVRRLLDAFELQSTAGQHQCLVQSVMHMSLLDMLRMHSEPFGLDLVKATLSRLLKALDYLHTEAGLIHTDLKTDNVMLSIEDETILERYEQAEAQSPSPRKVLDDSRTIYQSRSLPAPSNHQYGVPILCDLGEARIGIPQESGPFIQPHIYRAPEVIFEMPWGPPIDIWNLACLVWDLFEGSHLFDDIFDDKDGHDPFKHLALMVSLCGPPPAEFVARSSTTDQCFAADGQWIAKEYAEPPSITLEGREKRLSGDDKVAFLDFIRAMLRWLPEDRLTARQLLEHRFLAEAL